MAGLTRPSLLATAGLVAVLLVPAVATAADPAPAPTTQPPTCAERFPDEGPAGVDLRLGCVVSEVIGRWRPDQASAPPPLSAYLVWLGVLVGAGIGLGFVVLRLAARGAGRRLAPATPGSWWVCPACHSINGLAVGSCYNCGAARPADAAANAMLTAEAPETAQSFGRGKHDR